MIIGFDFDKVFINYPPLIPDRLVNLLHKRGTVFFLEEEEKKLTYKFPGSIEQKIRIISHTPFIRPVIKKNLETLQKIVKLKKHKTYLISSRYSFLKKRTDHVIKTHKLNKSFNGIHFNYENKQPHLFKEEMLRKLKIQFYIDDDLTLLLYLSKKGLPTKLFWLTSKPNMRAGSSKITPVKNLSEILKLLK